MKKKHSLIISAIITMLSACTSKPSPSDLSHSEPLKSRYESKTRTLSKGQYKPLHHYRSFNDDNLRVENPELKFVYFPNRLQSGVSSVKEVRLSMYERVHYRRGY